MDEEEEKEDERENKEQEQEEEKEEEQNEKETKEISRRRRKNPGNFTLQQKSLKKAPNIYNTIFWKLLQHRKKNLR